MVAFGCGEREAFFDMWEEFVPSMVRTNDAVGRDLEFSVCVHFALYPLKYQVTGGSLSVCVCVCVCVCSDQGSP